MDDRVRTSKSSRRQSYSATSKTDMIDPHILESDLYAFMSDNNKIRSHVKSPIDLPLNKYTSLGAIFEDRKMKDAFVHGPVPVIKADKEIADRFQVLGPLPPGKPTPPPPANLSEDLEFGPRQFAEAERLEPVVRKLVAEDERWNQPKPPNSGVIWPMAWAPRPPYTTPGYNRIGARQPVGVVQVDSVPKEPSKGRTRDGEEYELPTWVSPLYRTYGIGGPYGPFGPFYEPCRVDGIPERADKLLLTSSEPAPPKKCLLMRLLQGKKKEEARFAYRDKTMASFFSIIDERLVAIRNTIRSQEETPEIMNAIVFNLSQILEEAKKFKKRKGYTKTPADSPKLSDDDVPKSSSRTNFSANQ